MYVHLAKQPQVTIGNAFDRKWLQLIISSLLKGSSFDF